MKAIALAETAPLGLQFFERAKATLAACRNVDEVKHQRDRAAGVAAYAKMANDRELERDALEIRMRATRRLGEMSGSRRLRSG
jgi:cytochrome c peroxidase